MEWITVIGLILLGVGLIILEIIFVPGTTIVGVMGVICSGWGIYLGYDYFDKTTGSLILLGATVFNAVIIYYAFKSRSWERFSLKDVNSGKFNDDYQFELNIGDVGITISSLKPFGKAIFKDKELEVRSEGTYLSENQQIEIIKIENQKIIVKPITK